MTNNYAGIVLEVIRDQNKTVLEAVGQMQAKMETLATQESLDRLETKVDTVKLAVTHTNKDLDDLTERVAVLEQLAPK